jgi:hypothetical protein
MYKNIITYLILLVPLSGFCQAGSILSSKTISSNTESWIASSDYISIGTSMTSIGDLDSDGNTDLAIGCVKFGVGGGVLILFLESDGSVKKHSYIGEDEGGLESNINRGSLIKFGSSVASLGDLDGDGLTDIAVGSYDNYQGGNVYILFLNANGTVKSQKVIESELNGFTPVFTDDDEFGRSLVTLDDLDNDGNPELLVGNPKDKKNGEKIGAAYIVFLTNEGKVKKHIKISENIGGFNDSLGNSGDFGISLGRVSRNRIAIGSREGTAPDFFGKFWLVDIDDNGNVTNQHEITDGTTGFNDTLTKQAAFGRALCGIGDVDGDNVPDIAVGSFGYSDINENSGAVFILLLNNDGTIKAHIRHSNSTKSFSDTLGEKYFFGSSITSLGDFNGDGKYDLAVGVPRDLLSGSSKKIGRIDLLFLDGVSRASIHLYKSRTINIYPNPSKGIVNLDGNLDIQEVSIANQYGQDLFRLEGDNITQVQLPEFTKGIYYLKAVSLSKHYSSKLIIK